MGRRKPIERKFDKTRQSRQSNLESRFGAFSVDQIQFGIGRARDRWLGKQSLLPEDLLNLQHSLGNRTLGRMMGTAPQVAPQSRFIQRRLPRIKPPAAPEASKFPAALIKKANDYLKNTIDSYKAEALFDALAKYLESQGTVKFKGQVDIVAGSPDFEKAPSTEAAAAASQGKISLNSAAGFTFQQGTGDKRQIKVEVYFPESFKGDSAADLIGFLGGIIAHEYIHVQQFRKGGSFTEAQREFQAWLWQAQNAVRMGVRPLGDPANQIMAQLIKYFNKLPAADRRRNTKVYKQALIILRTPIRKRNR